MSADKLDAVVSRLESLATKLESISNKGGGGSAPSSAIVEEFQPIISGPVAEFTDVSSQIGGDVKEAAALLVKAFHQNFELMKVVSTSKKPSTDGLKTVLKPLSDSIEEVKNYASKHFKSEFKTHLEAIAAFASCFAWVQSPGKPQAFITENIDSGVFYSNRILSGFKDKGEVHKIFTQKLRICFEKLKEYTQEFHPTGCTWNPQGSEAKAPAASASSSAPPPKAAPAASSTSSKPAANTGALFSQLNQGTAVTSKLKKVDDSQKTHKNPNLRATAVVTETGAKKSAAASAPKTAQEASKPPKFELDGKKWEISYQINQPLLEVKEGDNRFCAYIFNCKDTNIVIEKKINVVSVDKCTNCCVVLKCGLISSVEITNSHSIKIQALDLIPQANVNSCHSVDLYIDQKNKGFIVSTNTSTAVNICYQPTDVKDAEEVVYPVPEVFESKIVDGKLITNHVKI